MALKEFKTDLDAFTAEVAGGPVPPEEEERPTLTALMLENIIALERQTGWSNEWEISEEAVKRYLDFQNQTPRLRNHHDYNPQMLCLAVEQMPATTRETTATGATGRRRGQGHGQGRRRRPQDSSESILDRECPPGSHLFFDGLATRRRMMGGVDDQGKFADLSTLVTAGIHEGVQEGRTKKEVMAALVGKSCQLQELGSYRAQAYVSKTLERRARSGRCRLTFGFTWAVHLQYKVWRLILDKAQLVARPTRRERNPSIYGWVIMLSRRFSANRWAMGLFPDRLGWLFTQPMVILSPSAPSLRAFPVWVTDTGLLLSRYWV
ncbi:MAG: hypothetical protein M1823_003570 [Watsoniomyces obsoletus]|nr:MAG: hypothetical protein M1823_003570 [Watsoniomyces obsoletus]